MNGVRVSRSDLKVNSMRVGTKRVRYQGSPQHDRSVQPRVRLQIYPHTPCEPCREEQPLSTSSS